MPGSAEAIWKQIEDLDDEIQNLPPHTSAEARKKLLDRVREIERQINGLPNDGNVALTQWVATSKALLGAEDVAVRTGITEITPSRPAELPSLPSTPVDAPPGGWFPEPDPERSPAGADELVKKTRQSQLDIVNHVFSPPNVDADRPNELNFPLAQSWQARLIDLIRRLCEAEWELVWLFAAEQATVEDKKRWAELRKQIAELTAQAEAVRKKQLQQEAVRDRAIAQFDALYAEMIANRFSQRNYARKLHDLQAEALEAEAAAQVLFAKYVDLLEARQKLLDRLHGETSAPGLRRLNEITRGGFTLHCPKDKSAKARDAIIATLIGEEIMEIFVNKRATWVGRSGVVRRSADHEERNDEPETDRHGQSDRTPAPLRAAPEQKLLDDTPNLFGRLFRGLSPLWWLIIVLIASGVIGTLIVVNAGDDTEPAALPSDTPTVTVPATDAAADRESSTESTVLSIDSEPDRDPVPDEAVVAATTTLEPIPDDGTGITVAVADVFGPEGVRVLAAPDVSIEVIGADGILVAAATTAGDLEGVFLPLAPGSYALRLDIGGYEAALPPECTDGYVTTFEIAALELIEFRASVYTSTVADDGTSVGTVTGDCITRR